MGIVALLGESWRGGGMVPGQSNTVLSCGVLQIEPTDVCNLRCRMCTPQIEAGDSVHGSHPKGFMPLSLLRKIAADIAQSPVRFDHVIFQWLGEPTLHPQLWEMVAECHRRFRDKCGYFRIDTNGVALDAKQVDTLLDIYLRDRTFPMLIVFSLDAVSDATYRLVKGAPPGTLSRVIGHIDYLLERRAALPDGPVNLNLEFQFVLQPGNAHETRAFVEYWDAHLAAGNRGVGYNEVMIKRLSVAAGGAGQRAADALYDRTLEAFDIRPYGKPHIHGAVWKDTTWQRNVDHAPDSG